MQLKWASSYVLLLAANARGCEGQIYTCLLRGLETSRAWEQGGGKEVAGRRWREGAHVHVHRLFVSGAEYRDPINSAAV